MKGNEQLKSRISIVSYIPASKPYYLKGWPCLKVQQPEITPSTIMDEVPREKVYYVTNDDDYEPHEISMNYAYEIDSGIKYTECKDKDCG